MPSPAPLDDELLDRLLDGSLPTEDVPPSLVGVATLLGLSRQAAEPEELAAEGGILAAMVAAPPADAGDAAPTEVTMSRTRRIVVLSALCTAGLATAAAALGAVSSTGDRPSAVRVEAVTPTVTYPNDSLPTTVPTTVSTIAPTSTTRGEGDPTTVPATVPDTVPATVVEPSPATSVPVGPDATGPAAKGLCTAWHEGKDRGARLDAPPFVNLAAAAAAQGLTTEEYCAQVLETHAASSPGVTAPGRETSATAPGATAPGRSGGGSQGQGGHNGNGGHGGGKGGGPPTNPGGPGATAPGKP